MADSDALPALLRYRQQLWLSHCGQVLESVLLPLAGRGLLHRDRGGDKAAVLIENRIDNQWLFTVLNTALMCPSGTSLCLICDRGSLAEAQTCLQASGAALEPYWMVAEELVPGTWLGDVASFNRMMKQEPFWAAMPNEKLLFIQTDALLAEPLPEWFFNFSYLGAPFLPRQQSEYFERRNSQGELCGFFKVDTAIHGSPNPDVYPHLHGNGGLSIRDRKLMQRICSDSASTSGPEEMEDVFFSRHLSRHGQAAPLAVARAFASESTYSAAAIGSHGAWKYFSSAEIAKHLERHWKQAWAMAQAIGGNESCDRLN
ncbi:DUF5672 family protein [Cyanobium sp. WAJ14-Wanaka]|uniref:DUF5672 family protein n=1 Tax=Cyanobium sp. WAJ14-Wanaka TaxID=2823725 RepID=UPI0020CDDAF6|nr:DUF5672 family protein [Cyanobium sp. WAJ14-Wanaka]MCP9775692.1 hypothetical protein [Cyanobium sp. WAJ14-Wanaka]